MDLFNSHKLNRQARYEYRPPSHISDRRHNVPNYSLVRPYATEPAVQSPPGIHRSFYYEPRFVQLPGGIPYLPSTGRSAPSGFDSRAFPSGLIIRETDPALLARRGIESKQDRFLGEEFDRRTHYRYSYSGERNILCHDSFLRELRPEAAFMSSSFLPLPFLKGTHSARVVSNMGKDYSPSVQRPAPSSPSSGIFIPDLTIENSHGQSTIKKKKTTRDLPAEDGFGVRKQLENQTKQKTSAFSRIQSGLSVWERLEENPNCSPSRYLSSTFKTSNELNAKDGTLFNSNTHLSKGVDSLIADQSCAGKAPDAKRSVRRKKKKNMVQLLENVVMPIDLSLKDSIDKSNNGKKKKKKKKNKNLDKEKDAHFTVLNLPDSITDKGAKMNSNTVSTETKKVESSSCTKQGQKIKTVNEIELIEAVDLCSQMRMETLGNASNVDCLKILNSFIQEGDISNNIIDDNKLNPADNGTSDIITEILGSSEEETLKLGKILNVDVNNSSQAPECIIIDDVLVQDSAIKLEENNDCWKLQYYPDFDGFGSSSCEIEQKDMHAGDVVPGEVLVSAGLGSNSLLCNRDEVEIDMTADKFKVIENCSTSFTEIFNKTAKHDFPGASKKNVKLTNKECSFALRDSSDTLPAGSICKNALNDTMSLASRFINPSNSRSEGINFFNNERIGNENRGHGNEGEASIRSVLSPAFGKPTKTLLFTPEKAKLLPSTELKKHPLNAKNITNREKYSGFKKGVASASRMKRHRTWLREGILSGQVTNRLGKLHNTSYFRKGNTLIRKLATEIKSECLENVKTLHQAPTTLCLPTFSKAPEFITNNPANITPEPDKNQGNDTRCSTLESEKNVEKHKANKVTYMRKKMNQLVAAPRPENVDLPKIPSEMLKSALFSSSFLYYRCKRNQIVRDSASFNGKVHQNLTRDSNFDDSFQQGNTLTFKERLADVIHKRMKPSRFSQVWSLSGDKLSRKCITKLGCRWTFSHVIPWKRAIDWKKVMLTSNIPILSRPSSSLLSRKLQRMRKRDMVYKVSNNGFSLRKAGVISVGGSSLKWSKSIEKRSKKASEEATIAVAEVERKKREKKSKSTRSNPELKAGERIFRVGSSRYKMDSSKRTLVRMSDDQPSFSESQKLGNSSRRRFLPKRLVVGSSEYVQIGNGNQLVRDPTKIKRLLANEKVRWSLHTARLRLARKSQLCAFFTRFGKCNKSEGKCPYIHESTKYVICSKFIKGHCFDANCKLAHKVIQEKMPDCSYFLKGHCTNDNCPYRHVKVNANAPLCDDFIKGLCADGGQCRKKHRYTCPLAGKCPRGLLCTLRHPKIQPKSRKRKRTETQNSCPQRYFSGKGDAREPAIVARPRDFLDGGDDVFCSDGLFAEFIPLDDASDNAAVENDEFLEKLAGKLGLEIGSDDLFGDADEHIKPLAIMNCLNDCI